MRQICEPIHIESKDGMPHRVIWRGGLFHVVSVEEQWRYAGKWWEDGRGCRRNYYRVTVQPVGKSRGGKSQAQASLELYQQGGRWVLHRVLD
jgi:hypothetical protein